MNKLIAVTLVALIAACAAAPTEDLKPVDEVVAEPGTVAAVHEQDKRAIMYRYPVGAGYYPGYRYRYAPPTSALSYLSYPNVPYYDSYSI